MVSMRESARKNLEKMVKGAAREVTTSRPAPARAGAMAAPLPSAVEDEEKKTPAGGISKVALQQLRELIGKNGRTIQKVPIESIQLHENIRETYDETSLKQLAASMEKDGLIQFPTLALKDGAGAAFICKNGHRRILAAKSLGWKSIECVILPFASAKDELYHTIAANLREDVFYLDMASAYQQAARLGESDEAIAERSGVNPRTVGWYRRLTRMSAECQSLARAHSDIFTATWAIKLARQGELPAPSALLKLMQNMIARQQAFSGGKKAEGLIRDKVAVKESRDRLKGVFSANGDEAEFAWRFVGDLVGAGFVSAKVLDRLKKNYSVKGASSKRGESRRDSVSA